jgi:hypothetical protein
VDSALVAESRDLENGLHAVYTKQAFPNTLGLSVLHTMKRTCQKVELSAKKNFRVLLNVYESFNTKTEFGTTRVVSMGNVLVDHTTTQSCLGWDHVIVIRTTRKIRNIKCLLMRIANAMEEMPLNELGDEDS